MQALLRNPLVLPVYLPTFLLSLCSGMLIPILPLYAKSFEISYSLVGLVLAADGIGHILGDLPSAILLNKLGRKKAMVLGVSCVAISCAALFFAPNVMVVIALRLFMGAGGSLWNISRHAYLTDVTSPHQRGRVLAVFGGVGRIGSFLGPAIGGFLAALYTLRSPFLAFGAIALLAGLIAALVVERGSGPTPVPAKGHLRHIGDIFKAHAYILITAGAGQLFAQTVRTGRHVIIPLYAADVLGLGYEEVGLIVSIAGFVDMAMFYPAGLLMDRLGRKFANVPCFAIQGIGMALIPFSGDFTGLLLVTCLIGFGNGIGSGTMMTLGADLAPKNALGEFLALWRIIGDGGHLSGPLVVGHVADWVGLSPAAYVIAGVGLLSAGIFAFLVPETLKKEKA